MEAPLRDIAAKAGLGTATILRHFPTRADLVIAVYRHQVEALAHTGPGLLADSATPHAALMQWTGLFADFLVTKLGLAAVLQSDDPCYDPMHSYFLDRLLPVCTQLLDAAAKSGEIPPARMHTSSCAASQAFAQAPGTIPATTRRLVRLLITGLRLPR